jgi:hypothetical protein
MKQCQKCQKSLLFPFGTFGTSLVNVFEENYTYSLVLHNYVRGSFFIPLMWAEILNFVNKLLIYSLGSSMISV